MATISDIAKLAGVSKTTVSRVLNNHKYVSEALRKRVETVAAELNYVPNGNAINLSTGKTKVLGILLPAIDYCYEELVDSILLNAKRNDYKIMILPSYHEEITEKYYYEILRRKNIDGLILASISATEQVLTDLKRYGKILSSEKLDHSTIATIYPDRKLAYQELFANLKALEKNNIVFTLERKPEKSRSSQNKINAYKTHFGKPIEDRDYFIGIKTFDEGYQLGKKLIKMQNIPEVIYTSGDHIAAGIIKVFKEEGILHGIDFQIVGEGNTPYSQAMNFSSIDFCLTKVGEEIVSYMISDVPWVETAIKPNIIYRDQLKEYKG